MYDTMRYTGGVDPRFDEDGYWQIEKKHRPSLKKEDSFMGNATFGYKKDLQDAVHKALTENKGRLLEEGKAAGLEEGKAAGLEEGKAAGLEEARHNIALKMLKKGRPEAEIIELTGVTQEELALLKNKI